MNAMPSMIITMHTPRSAFDGEGERSPDPTVDIETTT